VTLSDDAPGTASASAISTAKVVAQAPGPNPPVMTAIADLAASTEVKGTAEAGTTVKLYDNGAGTPIATGIAANDGTFDISTTARLAQGIHILTATATDSLNQTSSPSNPVTASSSISASPTTASSLTSISRSPPTSII
jgi:Bacterial Ig domain